MLTTRKKLEQMLVENGMFESQAEKVLDIAIPELNKLVDSYQITFDRPANEYPDPLYSVLFIIIQLLILIKKTLK